jgi:hypothetical protein
MYDDNTNSAQRRNSKMLLSEKYHIVSVLATGCPQMDTRFNIFFDDFGRPYSRAFPLNYAQAYKYRVVSDCTITLKHRDSREANITIKPETGYAFISGFTY